MSYEEISLFRFLQTSTDNDKSSPRSRPKFSARPYRLQGAHARIKGSETARALWCKNPHKSALGKMFIRTRGETPSFYRAVTVRKMDFDFELLWTVWRQSPMWHASTKVICQKKPVCLHVRSPFVCMCTRAQIYVWMHVKTRQERAIQVTKVRAIKVTKVNERALIWMSHVSYGWVMSHMNESCLIWMSHVSYD